METEPVRIDKKVMDRLRKYISQKTAGRSYGEIKTTIGTTMTDYLDIKEQEITEKQWEEAPGAETDGDILKGRSTVIDNIETELIEIRDGIARIKIRNKELKLTLGRYDLGDGLFLYVRGIIISPEEKVIVSVKRMIK